MVTGTKCWGSGYSEILIEAELVTTGCLSGVLKGKGYAKALFCLKTASKGMQRLLFERFTEEANVEVYNPVALLNLVQIGNRENLDLALQDPSTLTILEKYSSYEDRVRNGHFGKRATFWLSVIEGRKPVDFRLFLANDENKLQLCQLLLGEQGGSLSAQEMWDCCGSGGR